MHGKGSLEYPDGSCYSGEWRNGVQQGWGTLNTKDGTTQVQYYGVQQGWGTLNTKDGTTQVQYLYFVFLYFVIFSSCIFLLVLFSLYLTCLGRYLEARQVEGTRHCALV